MTRRLVITIEQEHEGPEAKKATDQVTRDIAEYARQRAQRFLCHCAKVTVEQEEAS